MKAKISKNSFPSRREPYFWGSGGCQIQQNSEKNRWRKLEVFQITLGIDFLWILERFWRQVGSQNGTKIDTKGGWKNDEKMMMTRMATKSEKDDYACARPPCPESRGGGRRRAKPLLQGLGRMWSWKELGGWKNEACHLKVKPPVAQRAGGISGDQAAAQTHQNHKSQTEERPFELSWTDLIRPAEQVRSGVDRKV